MDEDGLLINVIFPVLLIWIVALGIVPMATCEFGACTTSWKIGAVLITLLAPLTASILLVRRYNANKDR